MRFLAWLFRLKVVSNFLLRVSRSGFPPGTSGARFQLWSTASAVVFVLLSHYQFITIVGSAEVGVPISCSALMQGGPSPMR